MREIKRILSGQMKTLPIEKCPHQPVPRLPELTVEKAYKAFVDDDETLLHLPLLIFGKRKPDRNFVFDVLQVLHPAMMKDVIGNAKSLRIKARTAKEYQEEFVICQDYRQKLLKHPYKTSKYDF